MTTERLNMTTLQRDPGTLRRKALQAPIIVTHRGQDDLVVMSTERYAELVHHAPHPYYARELSDDVMELFATQKVPDGHEHLNDDVDANEQ